MNQILLARQSIYDGSLEVFAYELLFRPGDVEAAMPEDGSPLDGDHATSTVLLNTFTENNLETIVSSKKAFVNFTRNLLLKDLHELLPKEHVVIEVLEDIKVDPKLLEKIQLLSNEGFTIALDDFQLTKDTEQLLSYADIIKIDVLDQQPETIEKKIQALKNFKGKLLAEKIETNAMYEACKNLGFHYFQGYWLDKPCLIRGKKSTANRSVTLMLVTKLQDPDAELNEVEAIIGHDPNISYKLLRLINSACYSATRKMDSLREAIVRLGLTNIRNWASLIALTDASDKPNDVLQSAMMRAKMCELLAHHSHKDSPHTYFTVGLFSTLDALLDDDLKTILAELPLSDEINHAIINHENEMGEALKETIAYQSGRWDDLKYIFGKEDDYQSAYFESLAWAEEINANIAN